MYVYKFALIFFSIMYALDCVSVRVYVGSIGRVAGCSLAQILSGVSPQATSLTAPGSSYFPDRFMALLWLKILSLQMLYSPMRTGDSCTCQICSDPWGWIQFGILFLLGGRQWSPLSAFSLLLNSCCTFGLFHPSSLSVLSSAALFFPDECLLSEGWPPALPVFGLQLLIQDWIYMLAYLIHFIEETTFRIGRFSFGLLFSFKKIGLRLSWCGS